MESSSESRSVAVVIGLLLIVGGALLLVAQAYGVDLAFDVGTIGWPIYVIAPGAALLFIGLLLPAGPGIGLSVAGGVVTSVGLLLAYQDSTGHWASWAYAWALVAPTSVGAAMLLWAILHRQAVVAREGLSALAVGLALFLIGFAFFEGVLDVGGQLGLSPLGRQLLPVALIGAGLLLVLTRLWPSRRRRDWGGWQGPPPDAPPPGSARPPAAPVGAPVAPAGPALRSGAAAQPEERE